VRRLGSWRTPIHEPKRPTCGGCGAARFIWMNPNAAYVGDVARMGSAPGAPVAEVGVRTLLCKEVGVRTLLCNAQVPEITGPSSDQTDERPFLLRSRVLTLLLKTAAFECAAAAGAGVAPSRSWILAGRASPYESSQVQQHRSGSTRSTRRAPRAPPAGHAQVLPKTTGEHRFEASCCTGPTAGARAPRRAYPSRSPPCPPPTAQACTAPTATFRKPVPV